MKINNKSQILVVIIWVLLILTVLAIGIAHRVSFALRLSSLQNHGLQALYLAKSAVNLAVTEIKQSVSTTTSMKDSYMNNQELFEKIYLGDENKEGKNYAVVYYVAVNDNQEIKNVYGVLDQESQININKASKDVLLALFAEVAINEANDLVNNIRFWRGDQDVEKTDYSDLGYENKALPFINKQELMLVKGMDEKIYDKISNYICVNDAFDFKLNINTASKQVLKVIFAAIGVSKTVFSDLVFNYRIGDDKVWGTRDDRLIDNFEDYLNSLSGLGINERETLKKIFMVKSNYFEIRAVGQYGRIKKSIIVVYNRQNDKIIYYHES